MSRIGKRPVAIPSGVTANIDGETLSVKGPKGTLTMGLSDLVEYKLENDEISVTPANDTRQARNHWGMQRTLVSNLVEGVTEGFTKVLEINGVGYRAQAQGKKLKLQLGYSHDVDLDVPEGIEVKTPDQTTVEISGTADEESGGYGGVAYLAEKGHFERVDHVIIPEPLNVDRICLGHRGGWWAEIETKGEIAHGSMPFLGDCAVRHMGAVLAAFEERLATANEKRVPWRPSYGLVTTISPPGFGWARRGRR